MMNYEIANPLPEIQHFLVRNSPSIKVSLHFCDNPKRKRKGGNARMRKKNLPKQTTNVK